MENLYVNRENKTCVDLTSCSSTGGFLFLNETIPECLSHTKCSSLGRFAYLGSFSYGEEHLCLTDVQCEANNTQIDGKTCIEPGKCP